MDSSNLGYLYRAANVRFFNISNGDVIEDVEDGHTVGGAERGEK